MRNIVLISILLALPYLIKSQNLSFNKILNYYCSQDEDLILKDLKLNEFIIQKEQPGEKGTIYDSRIICLKTSKIDYTKLIGIVLLKIAQEISVLSYFTFDFTDIQNKIKEITARGFSQIVENPTTHWIFEKKDTLVTIEKRDIKVLNKQTSRYEISIAIL